MNSNIVGNRIKTILDIKNIDYKTFAKEIGITEKKLLKKLNGKSGFTLEEATKIKECLNFNLELADNVFFNPNFKINI